MVYCYTGYEPGEMTMKYFRHAYLSFLIVLAGAMVLVVGCARAEEEAPRIEVTARFTDPIDIEPQPSDKCIACHTKVNPITKLASEPTANGHGGDGG